MNELLSRMINVALDDHIGVIIQAMKTPFSAPMSDCNSRMVLINSIWHQPRELPFQLAHEIGHIENGDVGILKYSPYEGRMEMAANLYGLGLLVPAYFEEVDQENANVDVFMDALALPSFLHDAAEQKILEYYK